MTKSKGSIQWKPEELFVHNNVRNDVVTKHIVSKCAGINPLFLDFINYTNGNMVDVSPI